MKKTRKILALIAIIGMIVGITGSGWGSEAKVNINTGTIEQLVALKGIGEVTAQRIIDYRDENGPFKSPNDLLNIKGIGPTTLANILSQITVGDPIKDMSNAGK